MHLRHLLLSALCLVAPARALALTADELVLVVNKNEPRGRELAEFYAEARKVPAGRVVEVDVPAWDQIEFDQYEAGIARPVRAFLRANGLEAKAKCLVTFYGVPLRVAPRALTDAEKAEAAELEREAAGVRRALAETARRATALADGDGGNALGDGALDGAAAGEGGSGEDVDALLRQTEQALNRAAARAAQVPAGERAAAVGAVMDVVEALTGDAGTLRRMRQGGSGPSTRPAGKLDPAALEAELAEATTALNAAVDARHDPAARATARRVAADRFGLVMAARILRSQREYLTADDAGAAVDSELPFAPWPSHPRARWLPNLLAAGRPPHAGPPVLMVSRIDAPTPEIARRMIETSIATEARGLAGAVAVDAGFSKQRKPNEREFFKYDRSLTDLAALVQGKTKLSLALDRAAGVMPPKTVKDVALYCGWYSVRQYVPSNAFAPGAVGFHIASYELVSLHNPDEKGWCAGLLRDGAVATIGPVAEPYLPSFPQPDAFFPLLMTGRLTLAEAYWKTTPLSSWMMALVGDPLYNPYRAAPALKVEDLPEALRAAVGK